MYMYINMYVYLYMYSYIYMYVYVFIYVMYTYLHICTCTCTHLCVHTQDSIPRALGCCSVLQLLHYVKISNFYIMQQRAEYTYTHRAATHCNKQHLCTRTALCKERSITVHKATHCNALQCTATHCNTLQHTATHCNKRSITVHKATHCNTLQQEIHHGT